MEVLTTSRLTLRPVAESDAPSIYAYSRNPAVARDAGWPPHESEEQTLGVIRELFLGNINFVMVSEGCVIGDIGLVADPKRQYAGSLMIGYAMDAAFWSRGLMTEAARAVIKYGFAHTEADIITAYCYPFNFRSKRVLEKCGFSYEGTLRRSEKLYDGTLCDEMCYSLTREEFDALSNA